MIDRLEKSALRLVRTIYVKVVGDKVYYLKEKCYASKYDGFIDVTRITEEQFKKAVQGEKRIEELEFSGARLNIKNAIRRLY